MTDWRHIGARRGGLRGDGDDYPMDVEAALTLAIEKYGEPTAYEKGQFRTGFYIGIANGALQWAGSLMKQMNREQIIAFSQDAEALYAKHHEIVFGFAPNATEMPCPDCDGYGDDDGVPCATCRGSGKVPVDTLVLAAADDASKDARDDRSPE